MYDMEIIQPNGHHPQLSFQHQQLTIEKEFQ